MGEKNLEIVFTGISPGEKIHEIMVSEEECFRTIERNGYYVILPMLPELRQKLISDRFWKPNILQRMIIFRLKNLKIC